MVAGGDIDGNVDVDDDNEDGDDDDLVHHLDQLDLH